ncbi:MAG: hypothetical protein DFNUSKGM_000875 [Candidatus Fervidibacter sacchari]
MAKDSTCMDKHKMLDKRYQLFNAADGEPSPLGSFGPVKLTPFKSATSKLSPET